MRVARLGQRIGAGRIEQAVVLKVRGDHARQLRAQRSRTASIRGGRDIALGSEGGDGELEIVELALVGDGAAQRSVGFRRTAAFDGNVFNRTGLADCLAQILILGRRRLNREERQRDCEECRFHRLKPFIELPLKIVPLVVELLG